ncbi:MAG TPA: hypothetical protein PKY88_12325 [Anaerohalosphaeraceae bacterium]|nr:hypothetical protein [Anaerohalosphaeraceae bacterium]
MRQPLFGQGLAIFKNADKKDFTRRLKKSTMLDSYGFVIEHGYLTDEDKDVRDY